MCQLVVILADVASRPGAYRAGEVVGVFDDEHAFSPAEESHPRWLIVRVPGLPASSLTSLSLPDRASNEGLRRAQRIRPGSAVVAYLRRTTGVVTLTPRQAFELVGALEAGDAD